MEEHNEVILCIRHAEVSLHIVVLLTILCIYDQSAALIKSDYQITVINIYFAIRDTFVSRHVPPHMLDCDSCDYIYMQLKK